MVSYLIATENCYLFVAFIGLTGCPEDNIHIFLKQGINGIPTLFMKPVRNSSLFLWKYQMIFFLTILTCIQIRGLIWSLILFGGIFSYTNNIRSNNQEGRSKKGSEIHFVFQKIIKGARIYGNVQLYNL
ncbi:hypothetical protein DWY63_11430 [Blautia sp. AF26-2]|nr:hypothetical protein DWY63_11430 [Blautia sp. AF26-2]